MAGRISALPAKRYRVSFMAAYSFRVLPHTAMSRYMGKSDTSYQMKIKKRSMLMKSPKTPVTKRKISAKNSLTRV